MIEHFVIVIRISEWKGACYIEGGSSSEIEGIGAESHSFQWQIEPLLRVRGERAAHSLKLKPFEN